MRKYTTLPRWLIARVMSEGDVNDKAAKCLRVVDEVWVPTVWHQNAFYKILHSLGGPKMASSISVAVIPEAVDVGVLIIFEIALQARDDRRKATGILIF